MTTRRITGLPHHPGTGHPPSGAELARAHQTGKTVKELRGEEQREEAASVLDRLLVNDADPFSSFDLRLSDDAEADTVALRTRRRWALHVAIGVLRGRRDEPTST